MKCSSFFFFPPFFDSITQSLSLCICQKRSAADDSFMVVFREEENSAASKNFKNYLVHHLGFVEFTGKNFLNHLPSEHCPKGKAAICTAD